MIHAMVSLQNRSFLLARMSCGMRSIWRRQRAVLWMAIGLSAVSGGAGEAFPPVRSLTTGPNFHWFGYYDKLQFDPTDRYVLGMEVDFEHRSPTRDDVVRVGMIDLGAEEKWIPLGESRAWNWQQGCMLQWVPGSTSKVIWNDRRGDRFVSVLKDVFTGEETRLPRAIYTLSPDGRYAISTDFARIQNYRKGYGYPGGTDPHRSENAPESSGVYRMDLGTGEVVQILSYRQLAAIPHAGEDLSDKWHYVNHLLVSPDSRRLIFLNRWREAPIPDEVLNQPEAYNKVRGRYTTRMFTVGMDGGDLYLLDPSGNTSHFIWKDPAHITAWTRPEGKKSGFWEFLDQTTAVRQVGAGVMTRNGHNTYLPHTGQAWILNDTYPQGSNREQIPYLFNEFTREKIELGRFHQPAVYNGEWRCDTHPRASNNGRYACIDSPHGGNGRQLYLIDLDGLTGGEADPGATVDISSKPGTRGQ